MKILLAYICEYHSRNDYYQSLLPCGLPSIAAAAESAGHEVTLANYSQYGYKKAADDILKRKPGLVGLSLFSYNRIETIKLIKELKKRDPRIVIAVGGHHATLLSGQLAARVPEIDHIITGEGETAFNNLAASLKDKKPAEKIIASERVGSLDTLPAGSKFRGAMTGVNPNEQFKFIITSRGCAHNCSFCSSPEFWGRRVRYRSAENVVREIEYLYRKKGIIYFSIRDDNFTLNKKRLLEFTGLLKQKEIYIMWNCQSRVDTVDEESLREMKSAGLEHIQYGVESGSEKILDLFDKSIKTADIEKTAALTRKVGVYLSIYLMTGMKGETTADVKKSIALIKKILPGDGLVSPVACYPGTRIYNDMKTRGEIDDSIWFRSKEQGIFVKKDGETDEWMRMLVNQLGMIRERSWYRESDFIRHKRVCGEGSWVTDILEGDYFYDEENFRLAEKSYSRVVRKLPANPWGHLRMGKLMFTAGDFERSARAYLAVIHAVPSYYGGWLKYAEALFASGNRESSRTACGEAYKLNPYEPRILNLMRILKLHG